MPRRSVKKKRIILPDPIYNSITVHMLINRLLKKGKKSIACRIVYNTLKQITLTFGQDNIEINPVDVLEKAIDNVTPRVEIQPRRRGGAIQLVPRPLKLETSNDSFSSSPLPLQLPEANKQGRLGKANQSEKTPPLKLSQSLRVAQRREKESLIKREQPEKGFAKEIASRTDRSKAIALRWILEGCHKRTGQSMIQRLKNEIIDAYKKAGYAVKKRDELHKIAINNAMYAKNPQTIINAIAKSNS
uniref:Ribosomal protein S7 n=1 Tax=Volvocales sp. NrCl902 TaxID=2682054 RepID=A0A7G1GGA4_9CHLO|nr:ribosomal protein S7 [Volvocales sp. NrCl902]